jgi:hypothetical protein
MNSSTHWIKSGVLLAIGLIYSVIPVQATLATDNAGSKVLARVDNVTITQAEFNREIASLHTAMSEEKKDMETAPAIDFPGVMERLINLRLLILEARQIGLDTQPEFTKAMDDYRRQQIKQKVLRDQIENNPVTAEDDEVQTLYKRLAREFSLSTLIFKNEADAVKAVADIQTDGFEKTVETLKGNKGVEMNLEADFIPLKELLPNIGQTVIDMNKGDVSSIFKAKDGYMLFQVAEINATEDSEVMEEALSVVKQRRAAEIKSAFLDGLVDQYAQIDEKLLAEIDFSPAGIPLEEMREDNRPLAILTVPKQDEAVFAVSDLLTAMEDKYYHGLEQARQTKQLNAAKATVLRTRLKTVLLLSEAKRLDVEQDPDFVKLMTDYEKRMLFSEMIKTVIGPDVTFTKEELDQYYADNQSDFSSPKMYRLSSIPFKTVEDAEQTVDMLLGGADFGWLSKNAPGQLKSEQADLTRMLNRVVGLSGMTPEAREVIEKLSAKQAGWYKNSDGTIHVVYVDSIIAPQVQPLDAVLVDIQKKVFRQNVSIAINEYAKEVRKHYEVEIYDPDLIKKQSTWERITSFFD